MTEPLPETTSGEIAGSAFDRIVEPRRKTYLELRSGRESGPATRRGQRLWRLFHEPGAGYGMVDADALNCLAAGDWSGESGRLRVLTPHPGEMSRLTGRTIPEIQADKDCGRAGAFAGSRNVIVVLKGERTLIAFPDGRVWINPTGSPAMATGGTGDILTGIVSGLLGQFPKDSDRAVAAAVYLHGLAGRVWPRTI